MRHGCRLIWADSSKRFRSYTMRSCADMGSSFSVLAGRDKFYLMTQEIEHLRHIRATLEIVSDRIARVELRLTAVEGHLANLLLAEASQNSEIDKIKQRLDRIERRA